MRWSLERACFSALGFPKARCLVGGCTVMDGSMYFWGRISTMEEKSGRKICFSSTTRRVKNQRCAIDMAGQMSQQQACLILINDVAKSITSAEILAVKFDLVSRMNNFRMRVNQNWAISNHLAFLASKLGIHILCLRVWKSQFGEFVSYYFVCFDKFYLYL